MPNPTLSDVHINAPLTNISEAHIQDASKFVSMRAFPVVPVSKKSDSFFQYDKGDFLRAEAQARAPGTESAGSGFRLSTSTYTCNVLALHKDIDDQIRANADAPLSMDSDATRYLVQQMLIKQDKDWAADHFKTSVWGTDSADKWDSTNDAVDSIDSAADTVEAATGFRPNKLILTPSAFRVLKNNTKVLDRIRYTQTGVVTEGLLASLLGLDEVMVARGVENTAIEGATATVTRLFTGDSGLLVYSPNSPSLMSPSAGYTFTWAGYTGSGSAGQRVSRFRMDHLRSDRIEAEMAYDQKLVASALGVFFSDVTTA